MTEAEWTVCAEPMPMLTHLVTAGKLPRRKLRLFLCASLRRASTLLAGDDLRAAFDALEKDADNPLRGKELDDAIAIGNQARQQAVDTRQELIETGRASEARSAELRRAIDGPGNRGVPAPGALIQAYADDFEADADVMLNEGRLELTTLIGTLLREDLAVAPSLEAIFEIIDYDRRVSATRGLAAKYRQKADQEADRPVRSGQARIRASAAAGWISSTRDRHPEIVHRQKAENAANVGILRHLFGNPFQPMEKPAFLSSAVIDLARAVYEGCDSTVALHDALLEAGVPELAKHFEERVHPKGCWALDVILGSND